MLRLWLPDPDQFSAEVVPADILLSSAEAAVGLPGWVGAQAWRAAARIRCHQQSGRSLIGLVYGTATPAVQSSAMVLEKTPRVTALHPVPRREIARGG